MFFLSKLEPRSAHRKDRQDRDGVKLPNRYDADQILCPKTEQRSAEGLTSLDGNDTIADCRSAECARSDRAVGTVFYVGDISFYKEVRTSTYILDMLPGRVRDPRVVLSQPRARRPVDLARVVRPVVVRASGDPAPPSAGRAAARASRRRRSASHEGPWCIR